MFKIVICFILLFQPGLQDIKWVKTKVNDSITMELPKDFTPMTPSDIAQRYPSIRKPLNAFTNSDRLVDVSVNISATQWRASDIEMASEFFKSSIMNLYDRVHFIRTDIEDINGKRFAVFEFDSRINGEEALEDSEPLQKYSYLEYLVEDGRTLVFPFQCPAYLKESWTENAAHIMQSIKIK